MTHCFPSRQRQLEELQVLALQFHETVEPLGEWLSATERRLSSAEPMGTQTSKITQQINRHKVLHTTAMNTVLPPAGERVQGFLPQNR